MASPPITARRKPIVSRNPPGRGGYDFASLGSAGVGFRSIIGRHLMASAWVAVPYKDEPALGAEGTRVRFNAGVQF